MFWLKQNFISQACEKCLWSYGAFCVLHAGCLDKLVIYSQKFDLILREGKWVLVNFSIIGNYGSSEYHWVC